jgi:chromosome segregation ATPase
MNGHALRRTDVTDELLARRILALEERIERVETSGPSTQTMILDALVELRRDTADRFDRMDQRLDRMDQRFDQMDQRLDRMDQRFDQMDQRFDQMDQRLDRMDQRFDQMDLRFGTLEGLLGRVLVLIEGPPGGTAPPKQ